MKYVEENLCGVINYSNLADKPNSFMNFCSASNLKHSLPQKAISKTPLEGILNIHFFQLMLCIVYSVINIRKMNYFVL